MQCLCVCVSFLVQFFYSHIQRRVQKNVWFEKAEACCAIVKNSTSVWKLKPTFTFPHTLKKSQWQTERRTSRSWVWTQLSLRLHRGLIIFFSLSWLRTRRGASSEASGEAAVKDESPWRVKARINSLLEGLASITLWKMLEEECVQEHFGKFCQVFGSEEVKEKLEISAQTFGRRQNNLCLVFLSSWWGCKAA